MKIVNLFFFGFFFLSVVCKSCVQKKGAIIKYKSNIISLGELYFKKEFTGKFAVYNAGDEPLTLLSATADCTCTVPDDLKNKIILPNDSADIKFKLTPSVDGFIQQNIYLDNTSDNESRVLFLIRANVKLIKE